MSGPKYSICMANLNMAEFVEASLLSIYNQLDQEFEIVVVDGGSSDGSVEILERLEVNLEKFRLIKLPRDLGRKIGTDRNISIQHARGKYVMLHLDCDDLYLPVIKDWVKIFLCLEKQYGSSILVAGDQINMGRRDFLLSHGPYKNLQLEDREMWTRLEKKGQLIRFKHGQVRTRMKIKQPKKMIKAVKRTYIQTLEDLQQPQTVFIKYIFKQIGGINLLKFRYSLFRVLMTLVVLPNYLIRGKVVMADSDANTSNTQPRDTSGRTANELLSLTDKEVHELSITREGMRVFGLSSGQ